MVVTKCKRCGKEIKVEKAKDIENIKCGHCNMEFTIDKKTKRLATVILIVVVLFTSTLIAFVSEAFDLSFFILMIPAILIGFFAYRYTLLLIGKLGKLSYDQK